MLQHMHTHTYKWYGFQGGPVYGYMCDLVHVSTTHMQPATQHGVDYHTHEIAWS